MPRQLAIFIYLLFVVWLFARDHKLRPMTSWGLWIPLVWIMIIGSRPISAWFGVGIQPGTPQDYLKGSPLDANVYLILILLGFGVLIKRRISWDRILMSNLWFLAFFLYCFISVIWSDYPDIAIKRWVKDFGNVLMVLIILSEKDHVLAMKAVFLRYTYFALPLSMLFIKYLPEIGRTYNRWTWEPMYVGVTDDKNSLGALALFSGIFLIWDLNDIRTKTKKDGDKVENDEPLLVKQTRISSARRKNRVSAVVSDSVCTRVAEITGNNKMNYRVDLITRILLIVMMFWLIYKADSSTSLMCLIIGICTIYLMGRSFTKKQILIRYLGTFCLLLTLLILLFYSFPDILRPLFELLGEDMTLTGRTDLWADLFQASINPLLGRGYQSFWLGSEASLLWEKYYFHPNQAHNGYLDTYLNGGLIGVCLLILVIVSTGSNLKKEMLRGSSYSVLCFSFLVILVFSNWTEATFNKLCIQWILLIVSALSNSVSSNKIIKSLTETTEVKIGAKSYRKYRTPLESGIKLKVRLKNQIKVNDK